MIDAFLNALDWIDHARFWIFVAGLFIAFVWVAVEEVIAIYRAHFKQ